jgi:hypothetical protein
MLAARCWSRVMRHAETVVEQLAALQHDSVLLHAARPCVFYCNLCPSFAACPVHVS